MQLPLERGAGRFDDRRRKTGNHLRTLKDHEGLHFIGLPWCNFVSFVVKCRPIQLGRTSKAAAKTSAALVDFQRNG